MSGLLDEASRLLVKAEDALLHAEFNYQAGFLTVTVNRAYYSCYYCMTSALLTQNIYTRTHQGTHAKFAELFIKTGVFPVFVSEDVTFIFKFRQEADYDADENITDAEASEVLRRANRFLELTKEFFHQLNADTR